MIDLLFSADSFLWPALLAAAGIALMCGPLGCFIVWMRLAYFGDTIGHAALLGVVIGILAGIHLTAAVVVTSLFIALALVTLMRGKALGADTLLGILAHGSLALGLVLLSMTRLPVDVQAYLFGDILAVTDSDIVLIYSAAAFTTLMIAVNWRSLMLMLVSRDIAHVEGVNVEKQRAMLMLLIALAIAISIKIVGLLLVTSMLIIPAAAARSFARGPVAMAWLATVCGLVAAAEGVGVSFYLDVPTGPTIILAAIDVCLLLWLLKLFSGWLSRARGRKAVPSHAHE